MPHSDTLDLISLSAARSDRRYIAPHCFPVGTHGAVNRPPRLVRGRTEPSFADLFPPQPDRSAT